ncbi:MAG: delta-class carbonic anhydrase [Hyphomicrobiaceae bacterium]
MTYCKVEKLMTGVLSTVCVMLLAASALAGGGNKMSCVKAGPQAPRDITKLVGGNSVSFALAPFAADMNLCDIHFHRNAEHRASGYSKLAGKGDHKGYVCNGSKESHDRSHDNRGGSGCVGISAGDTIEVHWVFTSCDVKPGPTLNSCFTKTCKNPKLRVEARVFNLTDDGSGANFASFSDYSSGKVKVPAAVKPVQYLGSTTGAGYNDGTCSPFHVTWNVTSACQHLELKTINNWCGKTKNAFAEDHAHGVRMLVTDRSLLSPIK